jgi:hypothetical protein
MKESGGLVGTLAAAGVLCFGACASKPTTSGIMNQVDAGSPGTCLSSPETRETDPDLVADFTNDNGIQPISGRMGGFYVYGDTNGAFMPPKDGDNPYPIDMTMGNPYCSGPGSFHTKATGFNDWGAALGTDFVPALNAGDGGVSTADGGASTAVKGSYNATMYKGISFWAKGSAEILYVQVKFPDVNTDPQVPNPVCVLSSGFPNNCSPYLIKFGDAKFPNYVNTKIDTHWKQFNLYFADTQQDQYNTGYVPPGNKLDVGHMLGFAIQVNANYTTTPQTANNFEIWVDDVEFLR